MWTQHTYRSFCLLICSCDCHYFISCLGHAFINPARLLYFIWLSSSRSFSNLDRPIWVVSTTRYVTSSICLFSLAFRSLHCASWKLVANDLDLIFASVLIRCLVRSDCIHDCVLVATCLTRSTVPQTPITSELTLSNSGTMLSKLPSRHTTHL